jgi:hypothetical protein
MPLPLKQIRYNQEFRLPGRGEKDFYHLAQYPAPRGREGRREVPVRDRHGRQEWVDWDALVEPTTP